MSNFFYGFAIPVLAVIVVVLFRINAEIVKGTSLLAEIKVLLSKEKTTT